ncbi:MAG: hypothetical protein ACTHOR_05705 [Devosia sp.]
MKIKSLLLGSVAAAGLATGAHAADLAKGALTSLDVCDALGLSGLTISSDTDCLQITGSVSYMFAWGDYKVGVGSSATGLRLFSTPDDNTEIPIAGDAPPPTALYEAGTNPLGIVTNSGSTAGHANDWDSQMIAWLQAVASADSDFGVAKAVIKIRSEEYRHSYNGYGYFDGDDTGGSTVNNATSAGEAGTADGNGGATGNSNGPSGTVLFDKAYVSVGDSTVLTAGKTGTIANTGDDTPLNWLGLFNSDNVGTGVLWSVSNRAGGSLYTGSPMGSHGYDTAGADVQTGGHSIQIVSTLGNGITVGGSLEDLQDVQEARAGTAIGVISYASDNLTAHLTVLEAGILDGHPDVTAYHAGFTGTFDKFKVIGAIAGDSSGYYDALASAQATFDMFKIAGSVEATHDAAVNGALTPLTPAQQTAMNNANTTFVPLGAAPATPATLGGDGKNGFGAGASASITVSDGVTINIGGRYFDSDTATANTEGYQGAVALVAAITETLTAEGDLGVYGTNNGAAGTAAVVSPATAGTWYNVYYGAAAVTWAPGGGFTSSLKGEAYSDGAYKATFTASKTFQ